jgi:mannose-6-phosphate isomerase-like protein (cupin superfamily)
MPNETIAPAAPVAAPAGPATAAATAGAPAALATAGPTAAPTPHATPAPTVPPVPPDVARRLRELRESCDASVEWLAGKLSVPADDYRGFEDGSGDIPISVLYQVCGIFGVDFTELLTGKSPKLDTYCIVRAGQGVNVDRYPGYQFESVAFNFLHRKMEPMIVTLEDEGGGPHKNLVTHSGQEYNYVIEGRVRLTLGKKDFVLGVGDSCYFDPRIPHGQSAVGGGARFLTVILE